MSTATTIRPEGSDESAARERPSEDERVAAFEDRLVAVLNDAALSLMISIGHRTRLFDVLDELGAVTVAALAARASLDQRYVTEWLGAMTTGRIVEHDPHAGTYNLPRAHAQLLTRTAPEANLAVYAQYIPVLGAVEDAIVDRFQHGGGLDYGWFPRFHEVMEEDSNQTVLAALRSDILPLVPGLVDRLERGIHVIDVGCGRGRALNELAGWFPNSTFAGYDLSGEAVRYAIETAADRGLGNVTFHAQDAAALAEVVAAGSAGLVTTFDAVHDQADPVAVVRGIRHALADDGVYLAQDIDASSHHHGDLDHPLGPLLYTVSCLHCMTVSLARGGAGLGAMWGRERAERLFREAGFPEIEIHTLEHDPQNAYYVCRPT
jgi:SAM-dependent methyltransferase